MKIRVLTKFEVIETGDEVTALRLTWEDGVDELPYPDCTEDGALESACRFAYAAPTVEFVGDLSEGWFTDWLFVDVELLDSRRMAPQPDAEPVVEELAGTLDGAGQSDALDEQEVIGDLSGDNSSELGETSERKNARGSRKKKQRAGKLREGAGCKQPDQVNGWIAGRLLCVTKSHRTAGAKPWGRCEYRVRCNDDGSYTLEYFAGNRKDVKTGDHWKTASHMFRALMALPPDTKHHKMTIKRYFNL